MPRIVLRLILGLTGTALLAFALPVPARAEVDGTPRLADSPYDLINAVNALRASYGVAPYAISSILMTTAQNQADYMAATGRVSHTGAGGSSVTDRLLAAGYPLAGDLSLGGFRSENITAGGEGSSAQWAVSQWSGDSVHLTTMISADLTEIGAGISANGGRIYYVIDAARPTIDGQSQAVGTSAANGSAVPSAGGVIIPVVVSTPDAEGNLIHEVKAGQSLWQIAISYNTKIDEIKRLNNLTGNDIYPGARLLIRQGAAITPTLVLATTTSEATLVPISSPASTSISPAPTVTLTPTNNPISSSTNRIMGSVIAFLAVALLIGGLFAGLGGAKKK